MSNTSLDFPVQGLMPKNESGVLDFLKSHPTYDGRDVVVAIYDTGCDPGAPGLQTTSEGKPKFLDFIDSTGSGDVDVSYKVRANEKHEVIGLTGRTLKLNPDWKNPTGEFRLGVKSAGDLFPKSVINAITSERKTMAQTYIDKQLAQLNSRIESLEQEQKDKAKERKQDTMSSSFSGANSSRDDEALLQSIRFMESNTTSEKSELQHIISTLKHYGSTHFDQNIPLFDCVVWHDGERYQAVLDTYEDGDLTASHVQVLGAYRETYQFGTYSQVHLVNYTFNFYNDGDILSIVVAPGSHGTHVAGIVGAYHGDDHESNGQAPGCQMISIKIGDSAMGTMETGPGIIRAVNSTIEHGCDIVNMSYGESIALPNTGRISQLINEMVTKHGVIFVSSAGNAGPNLSTAGAPGATTEHAISVGAVITESMVSPQYSRFSDLDGDNGKDASSSDTITTTTTTTTTTAGTNANDDEALEINGKNYQWSSRGPSADGSMISISACGGAFSSVPNWTKNAQQQMNGTSMSSPAACGIITLLLSAFKQKYVSEGKVTAWKYTPHRIRHIVERSAVPLKDNDIYAQGNGLIHIGRAWDYAHALAHDHIYDLHHRVTVQSSHNTNTSTFPTMRGVYLRAPDAHTVSHQFDVFITPDFNQWQFEDDIMQALPSTISTADEDDEDNETAGGEEDKTITTTTTTTTTAPPTTVYPAPEKSPLCYLQQFTTQDKMNLNRYIRLVSDEPWAKVPSSLMYTNRSNYFTLTVNPKLLPHNTSGVYHTVIKGCIASNDPKYIPNNHINPDNILFTVPVTVVIPEPNQQESSSSQQPHPQQQVDVEADGITLNTNTTGTTDNEVAEIIPAYTHYKHNFTLSALQPKPLFYQVPDTATWCKVTINSNSNAVDRLIWLHSMLLVPQVSTDDHHDGSLYRLRKDTPLIITRSVVGGQILELKFIQPWLVCGTTSLDVTVDFYGVSVNNNHLHYHFTPSQLIDTLNFKTTRLITNFKPQLIFTEGQTTLRPVKTYLSHHMPCIQRDRLPNGQTVASLVVQYTFTIPSTWSEKKLSAYLSCSPFNPYLYDSPIESQLIRVFIHDKSTGRLKYHHTCDAFSDDTKRFDMVKDTEYTILLHLKHHNYTTLESLRDIPLTMTYKLPNKGVTIPIVKSIHHTQQLALAVFNNIGSTSGSIALYQHLPAIEKARLSDGDVLMGEILLLTAKGSAKDGVRTSIAAVEDNAYSIKCTMTLPLSVHKNATHAKKRLPVLGDIQPATAGGKKPSSSTATAAPKASTTTTTTSSSSTDSGLSQRQITRLKQQLKHMAKSVTSKTAREDYDEVLQDILPKLFPSPAADTTTTTATANSHRNTVNIVDVDVICDCITILLAIPFRNTASTTTDTTSSSPQASVHPDIASLQYITTQLKHLLAYFSPQTILYYFATVIPADKSSSNSLSNTLLMNVYNNDSADLLTVLPSSSSGSSTESQGDDNDDEQQQQGQNSKTDDEDEDDGSDSDDDDDKWVDTDGDRVTTKAMEAQRSCVGRIYLMIAKYTLVLYMISITSQLSSPAAEGAEESTAQQGESRSLWKQARNAMKKARQWGGFSGKPSDTWLFLFSLFVSINDGLYATSAQLIQQAIPKAATDYQEKFHGDFILYLIDFTTVHIRSSITMHATQHPHELTHARGALKKLRGEVLPTLSNGNFYKLFHYLQHLVLLSPALYPIMHQLLVYPSVNSPFTEAKRPVQDILPTFF